MAEATGTDLAAGVAAMPPPREREDFLRPKYLNMTHEPSTPTMSLQGFKTALLKRRLAEIDILDNARVRGARVISKTTIAKEVKAIKHELRGTKARAAAARLAARHREIAEETRNARAEAERAKERVRALQQELEDESKDIEKILQEEREERAAMLKENQEKREQRRAVVEAELERHEEKRHKLVKSLKDVINEQKEARKILENASELGGGTPQKSPLAAPSPTTAVAPKSAFPSGGWGRPAIPRQPTL